jgi:tellurite resistance protein
MARDQSAVTRTERNGALVEVMLLASMADGPPTDVGMQALVARVLERPEFDGTKADELTALVQKSAKKLASAENLETILGSLRTRLPTHQHRMLAFGLAAAVALADHRATRAELGLLKTFQAALGISEDEVAQMIDVLEAGGSLAQALGAPLERLYAEVMVLVSAADGKLEEEEARSMVESFASDPLFHDVSADRAQAFISEAVSTLASHGLSERLRALAQGISTHAQRLRAFRLAMKVAQSKGKPSAAERRVLNLLQATFGLADDEVERLRLESAES